MKDNRTYLIITLLTVTLVMFLYIGSTNKKPENIKTEDQSILPKTNLISGSKEDENKQNENINKETTVVFNEYDIDVVTTKNENNASSLPPHPLLEYPKSFPNSIPPEAIEILKNKIKESIDILRNDPANFSVWNQLGLQKKAIEDYIGAEQAWEYAGLLQPQNSISFNNLGVLYAYYLHDNKKAEENFLKAIENNPSEISLYFRITDFYNNVLRDKEKAIEVIQSGIKENPKSQKLKDLLAAVKSS